MLALCSRGSHKELGPFSILRIGANSTGVEIAAAHWVSKAKPVTLDHCGLINWVESNEIPLGMSWDACS